jgi:poly-beta-1,6-N-acetyl-D-glucosamine biosynthesis protein PgaD
MLPDCQSIYPECLIIESPENKSRIVNNIEYTIVFSLWCWWGYLWIPLIKTFLIYLGFACFKKTIPDICLYNFIDNFFVFLYGTFIVIFCTAVWSAKNCKKYRKFNRRKKTSEVNMNLLSEIIGVSQEKIYEIQNAKRIVYFFSKNEFVEKIEFY